jgi:DNA-binding winged helix-turn-helix (wHTH) protein/TolB-like protein
LRHLAVCVSIDADGAPDRSIMVLWANLCPKWAQGSGGAIRDGRGKGEKEMSTRDEVPERLSVGLLSFDPVSGELTGPSGVARIALKPAALLARLAARPGQVLTRDEVREELWPGGKVEFDQGIAFAMREVRKAIEAAGGDPDLIETIPKRGFRLAASSSVSGPTAVPPAFSSPQRPLRRLGRPLVAMLTVVAGLALAVRLARDSFESPPVVVVFEHGAEEGAQQEVARALGFELTTALTGALADEIGVVGPTGAAGLSGPDDTEGARASLGACLVVSGGIRSVGPDSVVVFTQVVRTSDRVHVWAALDTVLATGAAAVVVPHVLEGVEGAATGC